MKTLQINQRFIGDDYPPYIIAEISANHNGRLEDALKIVEVAAKARVDAVKIQTFKPGSITLDTDRDEFQIKKGPRQGMTLFELYQKAETPREWHQPILERAKELGVSAFSSPFDLESVDFLETLNVPAYKIASFELVDIPLIKKVAQQGKPVILSTGMASLEDISEAVEAVQSCGNDQIILLYCVSGYPTPLEDANIANLSILQKETGCLVGLSDHTLSISTSAAAVSLGACVIEKHITLSREAGGLDSAFSLEGDEFEELVKLTNEVHKGLGQADWKMKPSEKYTSRLRRSLYVVEDLEEGELFTKDNIRSVRPNNGLHTRHYETILGLKTTKKIKKNTPLDDTMFIISQKE